MSDSDLPFGQHEDDKALSVGMMKGLRLFVDVYGDAIRWDHLSVVMQRDPEDRGPIDASRWLALKNAIEDVEVGDKEHARENARLVLALYNRDWDGNPTFALPDLLGGESSQKR